MENREFGQAQLRLIKQATVWGIDPMDYCRVTEV